MKGTQEAVSNSLGLYGVHGMGRQRARWGEMA